MAGRYKEKFLHLLQADHLLWEKFKGGEEKEVQRQERALYPSFLSSLLQYVPRLPPLCANTSCSVNSRMTRAL